MPDKTPSPPLRKARGPTSTQGGPAEAERVVDAETLFAGRREIVLIHKGQSYRLRITAQDKLILTK